MNPPRLRTVLLAFPFLLYLFHVLLFGDWIVDDAGISFAYARNLAAGHGLVSQPGVEPVEGYSNPLWVFLLAPFFPLGLFDPLLTPKLLSVALVGLAFLVLHQSLSKLDEAGWAVSWVALGLTALNSSFVIWTVSGLENALYVALICGLFGLILREAPPPLLAGAVAAGIALTRPDGLLYVALYPLLTLFAQGRPVRIGEAAGRIGRYVAVFLLLFGGHQVFRVLYFGDLYPNTYHAKRGETGRLALDLLTFQPYVRRHLGGLIESATGVDGQALAILLVLTVALLAVRRRLGRAQGVVLGFAGCAALVYLLLPGDWMGEYRFATPFFPFFYASLALVAVAVTRELISNPVGRQRLGLLAAGSSLVLALGLFLPRSRAFEAEPTLAFGLVVERNGLRINRYADALGIAEGSFLLPDVGGALWASRLRIYDLGGLTDRTVARTLWGDRAAFHDYVFAETRPTFILTHGVWTMIAALEEDPRFQRDYLPLSLEGDPEELTMSTGHLRQGGIFVRREAVVGKEMIVERIRAELAER